MIKLKDILNEIGDEQNVFTNLPDNITDKIKYQDSLDLPDNVQLEKGKNDNAIIIGTSVPTELHYSDSAIFDVNPHWLQQKLSTAFKGVGVGFHPIKTDGNPTGYYTLGSIHAKVTINDYSTGYWNVDFIVNKNSKITPTFIKNLNDKVEKALYDISENSDYKELYKLKFGDDWWKHYDV